MIYHDLTFTAVPDPRHPGRFRIFAHPPVGETLTADRRTRILETHVKVADVEPEPAAQPAPELPPEPQPSKATQTARYLPDPDQIRAAAAEIRAEHLKEMADFTPKKSRGPGQPGVPGGRSARVSADVRGAAGGMERAAVGDMTGRGGIGEGGW